MTKKRLKKTSLELRDQERREIHRAHEKEMAWLDIDWSRIARAVEFYESLGYKKVEVPWLVEPVYRELTYPHKNAFQTSKGDLVGSAEQSFLQLAFKDKIQVKTYMWGQRPNERLDYAGRYVAVTPCFRDSQPVDALHQPYFMKVELFEPIWDGAECFTRDKKPAQLFHDAGQFFASEGALPQSEETDEGIDWTVGGIEVGSYGLRVYDDFGWLFGTGLAEPRFSQALKQQRRHLAERVPCIRNEVILDEEL